MHYQLNDEQIQQFHQQGYCQVPDFFSPDDIQLMRHELQALRNRGLVINKCTDEDGNTKTSKQANLQICPLSPHSDVFRSLAFHPPIGDAIAQCLHAPFALQLDQIFVKPAGHGYGTNWHQDNAYFDAAAEHPERGVGMWIAIDDTHIGNGTMRIIPNSHTTMLEHCRDLNSDHFITCADVVDESQAVAIEVKAGGVCLFNFGIVHCTKNNTSQQDRSGLALHFAELDIISPKHGDNPPHIRGPLASNGCNEFGQDLSTVWEKAREQLHCVH